MSLILPKKGFTYADYLTWEGRYELLEGVVYEMTPAPSRIHQEVSMSLTNQFYNYLAGKPCKVYAAPFDVRLGDTVDEEINTVVQPDISVICDGNKLDEKGCKGAPDLIVEIVSPASVALDNIKKLALYEKAGVKEYWIVHPVDRIVTVYQQAEGNRYGRPEIYDQEGQVTVGLFPELIVDLAKVFA